MHLRLVIYRALLLVIGCCSAQEMEMDTHGEDLFMLSGDWKFHAIYGDGSNYIDIFETPEDIVIDNDNAKYVTVKGDWEAATKGDRESTFYGGNYLRRDFKKGESENNYVRYSPDLPSTGFYEAFVRFPFASHLTAQVNLKHANGISTTYFNQRNRCDQWLSLGVFTFNKSHANYVEVTAITANTVVADAVMFRPVSKNKMAEAKEERFTVFQSNFDDSNWDHLKVPGHWGMLNAYSNYTGKGWYRKNFVLPTNWKASSQERIRLKFDAVYHMAKVFLNGKLVGRHQGGFTPFEFDVTDKINFNGPNVLAVEADNTALVGATWNWGGIIRDVYLLRNNEVRVSYQYIHAEPNLDTGTAQLKLKLRIENKAAVNRVVQLHSSISADKEFAVIAHKVTLPSNSVKEINLESTLQAKDVKLWHFDTPHLYHITTSLTENDRTLHIKKDRFGIRKVELTDSTLVLNGEPVRLAGFNRVSDHRYWGSSEPQYIIDQDVDLMKNAGANFMRIMHGTQNKKLIERCDEKGILIFEEVNVRELTNPEFTPPHYPLAKQWLKEMIERDINHPSIIGWSVGNELKEHFDYAKLTIDYVKNELDPYRLVTCVSNTGWRDTATPENDPNTVVDIIMHNLYPFQGKPNEVFKTLRSKWPHKPIFISEYGIKPMSSTSLNEDIPEVSEWNTSLRGKNPFVIGAALWTFNDYRSGYAATSPEENRVWGLVNTWRQKRKLYKRIQKEHSPIRNFEVIGLDAQNGKAEISITPHNLNEYPSYTLKNYNLVWSIHNKWGDTLAKKTEAMPVISPGDETIKTAMEWNPLHKCTSLHIALLSPNGYTRYQKKVALKQPEPPSITNIETGSTSIRIHFDPVFGADEYFVEYTDYAGNSRKSEETVTPYVDIDNLENGKKYTFRVVAKNEKGLSMPSKARVATPSGNGLPPIIWDAFIVDDKLVVGYSGESDDIEYMVKYGQSLTNLSNENATKTRGMTVIDFKGEDPNFVSIKKISKRGESNWSKAKKVYRVGAENLIYE